MAYQRNGEDEMSDMLTACPKCGCEDYVVYRPMPGHGDPSDTTCICPYCETEFKGVTPDES